MQKVPPSLFISERAPQGCVLLGSRGQEAKKDVINQLMLPWERQGWAWVQPTSAPSTPGKMRGKSAWVGNDGNTGPGMHSIRRT